MGPTVFIYNVVGIQYTSLVLLHKYDQGYITAPWNQRLAAPVEPEERPRPLRGGQPRWQQGDLARHVDLPADFRDRWIYSTDKHPPPRMDGNMRLPDPAHLGGQQDPTR